MTPKATRNLNGISTPVRSDRVLERTGSLFFVQFFAFGPNSYLPGYIGIFWETDLIHDCSGAVGFKTLRKFLYHPIDSQTRRP